MGLSIKHLNLSLVDGQTPLEDEEREGLKIKNISSREELDEYEQKNIESALLWLLTKKLTAAQILSEDFIKSIHYRMFKNVWTWAGKFRQINKNLGVEWFAIEVEIKKLIDDCLYFIDNKTYKEEEIAIRLKHRLVYIHPFNNGNGRHSRLLADVLMQKVFNKEPFKWGGSNLLKPDKVRKDYIDAVREADKGSYEKLIGFAKS